MGSRCPPRNCEVCCIAQSKYKCPNCLAPYCSLACFKKHKEVPCQKPSPLVEEPPNPLPPQRPFEVGEPSWVVDREQLQLIANSSAIQEILKDAELRRIIRQIDAADEPEDQLTNAMGGEVFRALTEKILSIVSPKE
ncbi:zinc finger HIT domain-containing protein 3-like [Zingiber officinale]|uniref:zinc finger HIT domain-containing protein 3-like n=1 Tax=Zingiber officinale TaxID=94328 RepID=UPI001C4AA5FB|nr:zinc finger HIT domain-containing protein 3-like [Zingiber officinale]